MAVSKVAGLVQKIEKIMNQPPINLVGLPREKTNEEEVIMKKSVMLMAGIFAMAFTGSALAAGTPMFAVQDPAGVTDKFAVASDGSVSTSATGFNYDGTTGLAGFGTATPTANLSVTSQSPVATRGVVISQHTTNAAGANAVFRKSRGTEAAPTVVVTGDYLGTFGFRNYDGTTFLRNGSFGARVNGTVTAGSVPTDLYFATHAVDSADPFAGGFVRMIISSTGNVGIGTTAPTSKLQVVGLPVYGSNALAIAGGLSAGAFYTDGAGNVKIVF